MSNSDESAPDEYRSRAVPADAPIPVLPETPRERLGIVAYTCALLSALCIVLGVVIMSLGPRHGTTVDAFVRFGYLMSAVALILGLPVVRTKWGARAIGLVALSVVFVVISFIVMVHLHGLEI